MIITFSCPTKVNYLIIMHYKSNDSLDYLMIKINWKLNVKLKFTLVLLYEQHSREIEKMSTDVYSFLRQRDWLFKENCHTSLSCSQVLAMSLDKTHFWRSNMEANEERAWKALNFWKLLSKFTSYMNLSLHTSSCNENRMSNMTQHHIPQIS